MLANSTNSHAYESNLRHGLIKCICTYRLSQNHSLASAHKLCERQRLVGVGWVWYTMGHSVMDHAKTIQIYGMRTRTQKTDRLLGNRCVYHTHTHSDYDYYIHFVPLFSCRQAAEWLPVCRPACLRRRSFAARAQRTRIVCALVSYGWNVTKVNNVVHDAHGDTARQQVVDDASLVIRVRAPAQEIGATNINRARARMLYVFLCVFECVCVQMFVWEPRARGPYRMPCVAYALRSRSITVCQRQRAKCVRYLMRRRRIISGTAAATTTTDDVRDSTPAVPFVGTTACDEHVSMGGWDDTQRHQEHTNARAQK